MGYEIPAALGAKLALGEDHEVVAIVETLDGAEVSEDDLVEHAASSIARYKLPKAVVFRPSIERSPAGKADYRWAREQAVSGS